jgi:hypothetical protein
MSSLPMMRSRTGAACSTVAGVLIASVEVVLLRCNSVTVLTNHAGESLNDGDLVFLSTTCRAGGI